MFVHLQCHSHYSFLRGVNPPEEIIAAAVEQKMPAVALTDTNGMYAAVPFCEKAKAAGMKAIVGVVLDVERSGEKQEVKEVEDRSSVAMVLLAADVAGYSNLCQLTTLRHLGALRLGQEAFAEDAGRAVTLEELAAHSAGVIALWPARAAVADGSSLQGHSMLRPCKGHFRRPTIHRGATSFARRWTDLAGGGAAWARAEHPAGGYQ